MSHTSITSSRVIPRLIPVSAAWRAFTQRMRPRMSIT